jgi:hypothetical protein
MTDRPTGPLTAALRRQIADHERAHLAHATNLTDEERAAQEAAIASFEATGDPGPELLSHRQERFNFATDLAVNEVLKSDVVRALGPLPGPEDLPGRLDQSLLMDFNKIMIDSLGPHPDPCGETFYKSKWYHADCAPRKAGPRGGKPRKKNRRVEHRKGKR